MAQAITSRALGAEETEFPQSLFSPVIGNLKLTSNASNKMEIINNPN
jgi:hypothetical protein